MASNRDEEPAKQWQINEMQRSLGRIETALVDQAKTYITKEQFESEKKLIHAEYGPMVKNIKWVTRVMVGLVVALVVQFASNLRVGP